MNSALLFSTLTILSAGAISLFLFFRVARDHLLVDKPFFKDWAIGYAFFSFVHTPAFVLNFVPKAFQVSISHWQIIGVYTFSFFMVMLAAAFWYRGTASFFTQNHRVLNLYPRIYLSVVALLILALAFIVQVKIPIVLTVFIFSVSIPLDLFIVFTFMYFFSIGRDHLKIKYYPGHLLIGVGWLLVFVLDIIIWYSLLLFPANFWLVKLLEFSQWYAARAVSHMLIFVGLLLFRHHIMIKSVPG